MPEISSSGPVAVGLYPVPAGLGRRLPDLDLGLGHLHHLPQVGGYGPAAELPVFGRLHPLQHGRLPQVPDLEPAVVDLRDPQGMRTTQHATLAT